MDYVTTQENTETLKQHRAQDAPIRTTSILQASLELFQLRHLLLHNVLHPIEAINDYLPHLAGNMFGGKTFSPATDIPDLSGKVILVTGGNTGLGFESIKQLVQHNASHIYLAARTPSKGEAAVSEIRKLAPSANITYLPLDLASFASTSNAAREFASKSKRLDILINNAGIMAVPPGNTQEGYEIQLGTNHMGHALFTKLLMPTLLATAQEPNSDVRIINLTSEGHNFGRSGPTLFDKAKLDACGTWSRYGYSKLANILFTRELAAHYPSITSVAIHPGVILTDLYASSKRSNPLFRYAMMVAGNFTTNVDKGTHNQLWAATARKEDLVSGSYYKPVANLSQGSACARDANLARELWEWTEKEIASKGY